MTNTPLLIVGGFLAAGLVGGLTAHLLAPSGAAASEPSDELVPTAAAPATAADLEALTAQVERLADRLAMVESGTPTGIRIAEGELPSASLTDEQLEQAIAAALAKGTDSNTMTSLVAGTLETIRAQEEAQRDIEREQRDQERLQARLDRMTERLGLYPDQASAMLDVMTDQDAKRDELRDQLRSGGGDMGSMRDGFRTIQDETNAAVQGILTAEQYTTYTEENLGSSWGGRGGGFGGGGGRGGGG